MYRIVAFIALLTLATIACSLGGESNVAPTATPFSFSNFPTATQNVVVVTSTPTATVAASSTPFTNNNSGNNNCQLQSGWPVYVVQPGDTLGTIAQATGSTVNSLTSANCLSNPDLLSVGQRLRVPRLPLPPTITPPSTQPGVLIAGKINFSESVAVVGDNVTLPAGKTITLSYSQAAAAITSVAFVLRSPNGAVGGVIGGDNNLNDGASILWAVPTLLDGQQVFANGFNAVGNLVVQSQISRVYTGANVEGYVSVSPTIGGSGGSLILQAGATVTVTFEGARTDLARAEFALFDPFADAWNFIGTDSNLANGASVSWVVPLDLTGQIIVASTYTSNGIQQQQQSSASLFAQQPTNAGYVQMTPFISHEGNNFTVTQGSVVTLYWNAAPTNATSVEFWWNADGGEVLLGTDSNPADGASMSWTATGAPKGKIHAVARLNTGDVILTLTTTNVVLQ